MTVLITGGSGKLGSMLKKLIDAKTPSHRRLDIQDRLAVFDYIKNNNIDTIIHCAALTNVRFCELHRDEAYDTNVNGTRHLHEALLENTTNPYFIYISTACVFSGDDPNHFYTENDIPYPKNYYGLSKLLGETVISHDQSVLIIRTNFIKRGEWPYESAFIDRFANYIYSDQLAEEIVKLMENEAKGLLHVYGDFNGSMFDFAKLTDLDVKPMSLHDYTGPPLTINMRLSSKNKPAIHFDMYNSSRNSIIIKDKHF